MEEQHIAHFIEHGYVVVEHVFDAAEIQAMRDELHHTLSCMDISHNDIIESRSVPENYASKIRSLGRVFYLPRKQSAQHSLYNMSRDLMRATYSTGKQPYFSHPLGKSEDVLPFIDHVAYRLPDDIYPESNLDMHIDRNPHKPFSGKYFRPIQSWIALTDHYGGESGGIKVVGKFHTEYDAFFEQHIRQTPAQDGGFFRMHSKSYDAVRKRLVPLQVPAGSVVYWDHHLPHATCEHLVSADTREIYLFSFLPDVPLNRAYVQQQTERMSRNVVPPAFGDASLYAFPNVLKVPDV